MISKCIKQYVIGRRENSSYSTVNAIKRQYNLITFRDNRYILSIFRNKNIFEKNTNTFNKTEYNENRIKHNSSTTGVSRCQQLGGPVTKYSLLRHVIRQSSFRVGGGGLSPSPLPRLRVLKYDEYHIKLVSRQTWIIKYKLTALDLDQHFKMNKTFTKLELI